MENVNTKFWFCNFKKFWQERKRGQGGEKEERGAERRGAGRRERVESSREGKKERRERLQGSEILHRKIHWIKIFKEHIEKEEEAHITGDKHERITKLLSKHQERWRTNKLRFVRSSKGRRSQPAQPGFHHTFPFNLLPHFLLLLNHNQELASFRSETCP